MKRKPNSEELEWNAFFWLPVLLPLICVAVVAIGFAAAAVIKIL